MSTFQFLLIHPRSITVHSPVEAQRPSTSTGLHRTAFLSASKDDGHWITLRLGPSHGRSASLGVNGGVGGPGRWASAWWLEGLLIYKKNFWGQITLVGVTVFQRGEKDSACSLNICLALIPTTLPLRPHWPGWWWCHFPFPRRPGSSTAGRRGDCGPRPHLQPRPTNTEDTHEHSLVVVSFDEHFSQILLYRQTIKRSTKSDASNICSQNW